MRPCEPRGCFRIPLTRNAAYSAVVAPRSERVAGVPRESRREDGVSRMQFLLDLRQRGINDVAVLRALDEVPRERFVEARFAREASAERALPSACGQTISQPLLVAHTTAQRRRWP